MISTADDLNKFFSSLLGGKLLNEQQLTQMLPTVPVGRAGIDRYGLEFFETKIPKDVSVWVHTGGIILLAELANRKKEKLKIYLRLLKLKIYLSSSKAQTYFLCKFGLFRILAAIKRY